MVLNYFFFYCVTVKAKNNKFNPQLDLCHKIFEREKSRLRCRMLASYPFAVYKRVPEVVVVLRVAILHHKC